MTELWSCPDCAFTYDAFHTDVSSGGYSCPACAEANLEKVIAEILYYVHKRSKYGDPDADELLAKYGHHAF